VEGKRKTMSVVERLFQSGKKKVSLWLVIFFLLSVAVSAEAVRITPDIQFVVENETYTVSHPMDFHTITIADSYIIFNATRFSVASGNTITISLVYLNDDIMGAGDGEKILEFYATTTSGLVWFDLSGFLVGTEYEVRRGGTPIALVTADGTGVISFSNSVWSTQLFEIYQNGTAPLDVVPPEISAVGLVRSPVFDTEVGFGWENISGTVTDNVAVDAVFLRVVYPDSTMTNGSMAYIVGGDVYYVNTTLGDYGNYSYSLWANDTSGNTVTSVSYAFSMPPNWDVNNDGGCNVFDLVLISNHYGETGTAGWIREDVDNNGQIQVFDLVLLSGHYGASWWV